MIKHTELLCDNRYCIGISYILKTGKPVLCECQCHWSDIVKAIKEYKNIVEAFTDITEHSDPDSTDADNYRADDPEGALDTINSIANTILERLKK